MTTAEYKELLTVTKPYSDRISLIHNNLSTIIDIATQMKYISTLKIVKNILETYGTIATGKVDNKCISYIKLDIPVIIEEKISNLKLQVENQRECDISEKILCLR